MNAWGHGCILSLAVALTNGDTRALFAWITEHVGVDSSAWEDFAVLLVALAASGVDDDARKSLDTGEPIVYAVGVVEGRHVEMLAVRMLVMNLNGDIPGVRGVLAAVREADDLEALCGALSGLAHRSLAGGVLRIVEAL